MLNKKKNNKGFTLVELLVVIAIIGILAVVAVPSLFKNIEKGKVAELESDISAIRSAVLSYYAENSEYPVTDEFSNSTLATGDLSDHQKARNTILKEVESLGFPFKGSYTLSGNEPGKALLTIDLSSSPVKLSKDAAKKLVNDLGKVLMIQVDTGESHSVYTESGNKINLQTGEDLPANLKTISYQRADGNLETFKDLNDDNIEVSKIIIELMDGENQ